MPKGTSEMPSLEFEDIYETNAWGLRSGVGSLPLNNIEYIKSVQEFILRNKVSSIIDFGCGDCHPALSRAQEHPAHGALHPAARLRSFQRLLGGLANGASSPPTHWVKNFEGLSGTTPSLVAFQRQDVIRLFVDDLLCDVTLAPRLAIPSGYA
jgi:hypothetical protein